LRSAKKALIARHTCSGCDRNIAWLLKPIRISISGKFINAPSRLGTWLPLANVARDETPPADALRDYFLILEDMLGRDEPSIADIKYMRDFVSHGDRLTNPGLQRNPAVTY
jgi:hypothetical protein